MRVLTTRRQATLRIPLLSVVALVLIALGVMLDFAWPAQFFSLTIGLSLGSVFIIIGIALALGVLVPTLMWREVRQARTMAREFGQRATLSEERARAQELAHARFMRELDHELKNPLQAIKSVFADLGETDGLTDSIQTARAQVDRLRLLSGRLRRIAGVTPGSVALETVDLNELVDDAIELAGTSTPGSAERVRIVVPQTPWRPAPILADRELVSHAIFNLLDNALKYSPESSMVEVRLHEDRATATIEVADAGIGIDPDDLPHVMEELYRSDRTNWIEGSGLGLALVNRVAAAHSGRFDM